MLVLSIISPFKISLQATKRLAHPCYVLHSSVSCRKKKKKTIFTFPTTRPVCSINRQDRHRLFICLSVCSWVWVLSVCLVDRACLVDRRLSGVPNRKKIGKSRFSLYFSRPSTRRSTKGRSTYFTREMRSYFILQPLFLSHAGKDRPKLSLHLFLNVLNTLISINVSLTLLQDQADASS